MVLTVEVDRDTTIAVAPYVVQNYHPYSGNGEVEDVTYTERMPVKKDGILSHFMQSLLFNTLQQARTKYTDLTKMGSCRYFKNKRCS